MTELKTMWACAPIAMSACRVLTSQSPSRQAIPLRLNGS